jgi:hypothetical protein
MPRLYLFAEGQTEQTFADTVLKPHLARLGVYMHNPVLIAHARRKGRVHRGGGWKYQPMKNDIVRFLKQESGRDVFFTTMIDLYGLYAGFPGVDEAEKLQHDPHGRVKALEASWAADIGDPRFIPFIQLHEYEAYLFVDVAKLGLFYPDADAGIGRLKDQADAAAGPELIDDGEETAPSKRIIREFPAYEGAKPTVGPQMGETIGLAAIRAKCPHFREWLGRLEGLGGTSVAASGSPAGNKQESRP